MTRSLPAPVLGFLKRVLPDLERDFVIGDLEERYLEIELPRKGHLRATLWLWRVSFSLTCAYFWSFIRHGKTREVDVNLAADRYRRRSRFESGDNGSSGPLDRFGQHLLYSLRRLRYQPAFSAIVIITLALGIGANVAIFSLVNAILIRPLPYPDPGELVTINHTYPTVVSIVSTRGFHEYRDNTTSFERVAATTGWVTNLTGLGDPERLIGGRISWDYFDVFEVEPAMGRTFLEEEDVFGNSQVVILSYGFWNTRLGADPGVIGKMIQLNSQSFTIVGVMPEGFQDFFGGNRMLWTPLAQSPQQLENQSIIWEWLACVARLKEDVSIETAQAEMAVKTETFMEELTRTFDSSMDLRIAVTSLTNQARAGFRSSLLLLLAAVGIVLLLTCANVANMLLARSIRRRKEIAVRRALGAGRGRLVGMLLTESVVLSGLGGLAGLFLAYWGIKAIVAFGPAAFGAAGIVIDIPVLLFTLGITFLTGVLFGLAPATQASRLDIQGTLREGGLSSQVERSGNRLRKVLVAAEFAMALIVLTGAGLLIRTIDGLKRVDPGFEPRNVLTASISLPATKYSESAKVIAFYDELLARLAEVPGIEAVATASQVPFTGQGFTTIFNVEGYVIDDDHPRPWGDVRAVSPGFFDALGIPLVEGRTFEATDGPESRPVIVVDEVAVERLWPEADPIGKRAFGVAGDEENNPWFNVAGVVGHAHQLGLVEDTHLQVYFSTQQNPMNNVTLVIRTTGDPIGMVPAVRATVLSIDPDQPISNINTMEDLIAASIGGQRTTMLLLVIFAVLAIVLASIGIYGVMSQMVGERTREIGVRMACGATRRGLIRMVLKQGLTLAVTGTAVGIAGSLLLAGTIRSLLYEVSPFDLLTLVSVVILILFVALISTFLPAVRAAMLDPVICLRTE